MVIDPLFIASRVGPVVLVLATPFAMQALLLLAQELLKPQDPSPELDVEAGEWLRRKAAEIEPGLTVEAASGLGADAYWPGLDRITLTASTSRGRGGLQRTIAAHELGHAHHVRRSTTLEHLLPGARLLHQWGWQLFGASVVVTLLLEHGSAMWFMGLGIAVSVGAGAIVLMDEAMASTRALEWLEPEVRGAPVHLMWAFALYAIRWVGQMGVLLTMAWWLPLSLDPSPASSLSGLWSLAFIGPILILRAVQVGVRVFRPTRVDSDFRMGHELMLERHWSTLAGWAAAWLVCSVNDQGSGLLFAGLLCLATMVAMGPIADMGRAWVLLPILLIIDALKTHAPRQSQPGFSAPSGERNSAMAALWSTPPWTLRASWAMGLGWVPLVTWLTVVWIGV